MYHLESFRAPSLVPQQEKLVYERVWIDPRTKLERHSIWMAWEGPVSRQPLESGEPDARSPVISPDGRWIAFLSTRPRPAGWKKTPPSPPSSDPVVDLWMKPVDGGPAIPLGGLDQPWGRVFNDGFYGHVAFSTDSTRLVFVADDGKDPRTRDEIVNDVEIVRPDQGEGYTGYGPAQIWIAELARNPEDHAAAKIQRLTRNDVWYGDPQWFPDGKAIVVHSNKTRERESVRFSINRNFDLYALDVTTGQQRQLTTGPGPDVSPRVSPDGKQVAFLSVPRKGTHRDVFNVGIVTLGAGGPRTRIVLDHHGQSGKGWSWIPAFPLPRDTWVNESTLQMVCEERTGTCSRSLDTTSGGEAEPDAQRLARQVTESLLMPPNDPFSQGRLIAKSEVIHW